MFPSTAERERENTYPKRENNYSYEEREYSRRPSIEPYDSREREERDYRYRTKREWIDRDYHSGPYELHSSPGKRRKLGRDETDYYEKRDYYNDKREYYERDPFTKSSFSSSYRDRERESDYTSRSNFSYRSSSDYGSRGGGGWDGGRGGLLNSSFNSGSKYDKMRYYDYNGYRKEPSYEGEPYRSSSGGRSYERDERELRYDGRYDREYLEKPRDSYNRDRYDYEYEYERDRDREHSHERDYEHFKHRERGYYSPREGRDDYPQRDYEPLDNSSSSSSLAGGGKNDEAARNELNAYLGLSDEPMEKEKEEPTPKKRLGWGQGLMAMQKKKEEVQKEPDNQPSTLAESTTIEPQEIRDPAQDRGQIPQQISQQISQQNNTLARQSSLDSLSLCTESTMNKEDIPMELEEEPPINEYPPLPSKEEVLQSIERVDAEISKMEMLIHNLKKPKKTEHKSHRLFQTLWEQIYEDNKERSASNQEDLLRLLPSYMKNTTTPIYRVPEEIESYKENKKKHESIRHEVASILWRRKCQAKEKEENLMTQYRKLHEKWKKKIETLEAKRKKRDQKQQKVATGVASPEEPHQIRRPILRSQVRSAPSTPTNLPPRGNRAFVLADTVRSEAEFDQIMTQLKEEDDKDPNSKYIKTIAKIPPMVLDRKAPRFVDKNGLVEDPMAVERERKMMNPWTEQEKAIFLKKFTQHPKNFSKIATYLESKTTNEVVWYYYANKKTLDLKKILVEQQSKRRGFARKITVTTPNSSVPRELSNLGNNNHYWLSETGRVQRATVRNVNYAEVKDEFCDSKAIRPTLLNPELDSRWNENEKETFLDCLARFGKDFKAMSNYMGTKTEFQCHNYYHNNKKKFNFDKIIEEGLAAREKKKALNGSNPLVKQENEEKKSSKEDRRVENSWSDAEKADFLKYFKEFGKNWKKIAANLTSKSQNQIKYYFQVSRVKLNLDQIEPLEEFTAKKRGRKQSIDRPRKLRKKGDDSDSSAAPSPIITEVMNDDSRSPLSDESSIASSLVSLATTVSSLVERALESNNPREEVTKDEALPSQLNEGSAKEDAMEIKTIEHQSSSLNRQKPMHEGSSHTNQLDETSNSVEVDQREEQTIEIVNEEQKETPSAMLESKEESSVEIIESESKQESEAFKEEIIVCKEDSQQEIDVLSQNSKSDIVEEPSEVAIEENVDESDGEDQGGITIEEPPPQPKETSINVQGISQSTNDKDAGDIEEAPEIDVEVSDTPEKKTFERELAEFRISTFPEINIQQQKEEEDNASYSNGPSEELPEESAITLENMEESAMLSKDLSTEDIEVVSNDEVSMEAPDRVIIENQILNMTHDIAEDPLVNVPMTSDTLPLYSESLNDNREIISKENESSDMEVEMDVESSLPQTSLPPQ